MKGCYSIELWNCRDRTLRGEPRTNNVSEGGNNSLRVAFAMENPVIWTCIDKIVEFQSQTDMSLVHQDAGQLNVIKKRRWRQKKEAAVKRHVTNYTTGVDVMDFLKRLSYMFVTAEYFPTV